MAEMATPSSFGLDKIDLYPTTIRVLGVGGAGNNTIDRLYKRGLLNVETVAVNTDAQHLLSVQAHRKVLIGKNLTAGLGAGGDPQIGEKAAEESKNTLLTILEGTDLLFLTGGLGGGTGTGAMPVIGKLARELGTLTVAVVTMPFSEEGLVRWENAKLGLQRIKNAVDTVIVLRNDKLLALYPEMPLLEAFQKGDEVLIHALTGLSEMVLNRGLINLDFADIRSVMTAGPGAVIGLGESSSENRIEEAIRKAMSHPMMEADVSGAQSALVHVTGGTDFTLKEARQIIQMIAQKLDPNAKIIWGVTIEKAMKKNVRVMLIAAGLKQEPETPFFHHVQAPEHVSEYTEPLASLLSPTGPRPVPDNGKSIFDIKETILSSEEGTGLKPKKGNAQTSLMFYKIFEEEAASDLRQFNQAVQELKIHPENRQALEQALRASKFLHASAQMFGFDEIAQLLNAVYTILSSVYSKEIHLTAPLLDSLILAVEMVMDLVEKRADGRGETGYIVNRLLELKNEQLKSVPSGDNTDFLF